MCKEHLLIGRVLCLSSLDSRLRFSWSVSQRTTSSASPPALVGAEQGASAFLSPRRFAPVGFLRLALPAGH